jgi:hypothetical protein
LHHVAEGEGESGDIDGGRCLQAEPDVDDTDVFS